MAAPGGVRGWARDAWRQHCNDIDDALDAAQVRPIPVLLLVSGITAVLLGMAFVPVARSFTGFELPWYAIGLTLLGGSASLLAWRFWSRPQLRGVLVALDSTFYCLAVVAVMLETTAPTRYVFGLVYGQMATDYGRRVPFSPVHLLGIGLIPAATSLIGWPDFALVALVFFGAAMFAFTSRLTDDQRRLVRQNRRLRSAFDTADTVATESVDIALAATVTEMGGFLHHLRNALTPVVGNVVYVSQSEGLGAEEAEALRDARQHLARSCELLDKLIVTVKGRSSQEATVFTLAEVLRTAAEAQLPCGAASPTIVGEVPGFEVGGNPDHLQLALENLARNAAEAGASRVRLSVQTVEGGQKARIRIEDDGPGLPPLVRENLFTRPVTLGKKGGHGFGIYISRRLVELLGGALRLVESSERGTTFEIDLPRRATRRPGG